MLLALWAGFWETGDWDGTGGGDALNSGGFIVNMGRLMTR